METTRPATVPGVPPASGSFFASGYRDLSPATIESAAQRAGIPLGDLLGARLTGPPENPTGIALTYRARRVDDGGEPAGEDSLHTH